jgi:hypothetical protein
MILTILVALMTAFRKAQADESVMISVRSLFTRVRGSRILRTSPHGVLEALHPFLRRKKGIVCALFGYEKPTMVEPYRR